LRIDQCLSIGGDGQSQIGTTRPTDQIAIGGNNHYLIHTPPPVDEQALISLLLRQALYSGTEIHAIPDFRWKTARLLKT